MTIQNINTNSERTVTDGRVNRPSVAKAKANTFALNLIPVLEALNKDGIVSPGAIAVTLNERGVPTARNGKWAVTTVTNLISRLALIKSSAEVAA
jgi:hypothetical protein